MVDGRPVRWHVAGAGDPLVCVHGLSGSWRWWRPVLAPLAACRRVHLVDVPRFATVAGFGPGDAADWLGRWLDAAGLEQVDLVGHSLGALLAAQLAGRRADTVRRLALVCPAGIPSRRSLVGSARPLLATLRSGPPALLVAVTIDGLRAGPASLFRGGLYEIGLDLRPELRRLEAPTLLVWGEHDTLVPARLASEWLACVPHARSILIDAGHVPMFDAPRALSAALLEFLD